MQWRTPTLAEEMSPVISGSNSPVSHGGLPALATGALPDGGLIVAAGVAAAVDPTAANVTGETTSGRRCDRRRQRPAISLFSRPRDPPAPHGTPPKRSRP